MTKWRSLVFPVVLLLAFGIIVLQGFRILELQHTIRDASTHNALASGERVPAFTADSLSGEKTALAYGAAERTTILYVFSPSCVWCARNADAINALNTKLSGKYRIVGLSLDSEGLAAYVRAHHLRFPVLTNIPDPVISAYRLWSTPETLVIGPDGTVIRTWVGAYTQSTKLEIERFFSLTLPDLS